MTRMMYPLPNEEDFDEVYTCKKCKEEWTFYPDDYENPWDYPAICPLCEMPIFQMFHDIKQEEGTLEAIKQVARRIFRR